MYKHLPSTLSAEVCLAPESAKHRGIRPPDHPQFIVCLKGHA
ncbi:hypothetical protein [Rhodobacter ferrooxidans]|nr:hypothetical protein [Rhodobacter sp. SW2]